MPKDAQLIIMDDTHSRKSKRCCESTDTSTSM
jgi:hypothetical protein